MLNKEYISRVLKYNNVINKFKSIGLIRVFSDNIGEAAGLSSSQVRKDFSELKISGNKRGGYNVDDLMVKMEKILGKGQDKKVIVVGCGHIGQALMNYQRFISGEINIVAGFDIDQNKTNPNAKIPIYPLSEMKQYLKKNNIKVGIIAVPDTAASDVYEQLKESGVKGVLNFARVHLKETENCLINTINIELKIENLFYFVNAMESKE
ncbi:MAG: redox-sensing transcriptional repressor Rex, partial [Candidatus Margulisbacteria bacterium]|nr:redox-sensing transcriptional repressor Rex [Candidatus Margulisiibacteriota bacterium]